MLERLLNLDRAISQYITSLYPSGGSDIMERVTHIADPQILTPISVLIFLLLLWFRKSYEAILFGICMLGGLGIHFLLKQIIQRARPEEAFLNIESYSFPSGHAMMSLLFFTFLIILSRRENKNKLLRNTVIVLSVFMFLLIGSSRIVLNVHWFSDVMTGWIMGALWLWISIRIAKKI